MALVILRGLPGSGKSIIAQRMVDELGYIHYETGMYWRERGICYNRHLLTKAHADCLEKTRSALEENKDVVVANTFIRYEHVKEYTDMAKTLNVDCAVLKVVGKRIGHSVPRVVIDGYRKIWEDYPGETEIDGVYDT
jgi:predicted kinase